MQLSSPKTYITAFFLLSTAAAQQTSPFPECTYALAHTDNCAAVINANACYNKFRWSSRTWTCIDGENGVEKQRKVCECCRCVGKVMCDWVSAQNVC
ncbi:hypothetical protein BDW02DRAFT_560894 [Decorospora gaudefroyi]|uniref:Chitin-binding type-2 domain-containing protein n=1 Tax=Decorospora gaudefroyi TaxID=184978 RepID=A0A6A5JZ92_9PLEO|nr:hypothetical protein BDW02DRAFT_560894 [Decorospora gaudefroyi]